MNDTQATTIHPGQSATVRAAIIGMGTWGQNLVDSVQGKSDADRVRRRRHAHAGQGRGVRPPARHPHAGELRGGAGRSRRSTRWCWPRRTPCTPSRSSPPRAPASTCSPRSRSASPAAHSAAAVQACAEHKVTLAVGYNWRFQPALQEIKRMLADGRLGKLLHIEGNFCGPSAYRFGREHWRQDRDEVPGRRHDRPRRACGRCDALPRGRDRSGLRAELPAGAGLRRRRHHLDAVPLQGRRHRLSGHVIASAETWRMQVFGSKGWAEVGDVEHLTTWQMKVCFIDPRQHLREAEAAADDLRHASAPSAPSSSTSRAPSGPAGRSRCPAATRCTTSRCWRPSSSRRAAALPLPSQPEEQRCMSLSRRSLGCVTAALLLSCVFAQAQPGYPNKVDPRRRALAAGRAARPDRPHGRDQADAPRSASR